MDYVTLTSPKGVTGSIADWANTSKIEAAEPAIVQEAESFIYRRLRHWQMLVEVSGNLTVANADALTLPTNFLGVKSLYITGINFAKLTLKTDEEVKAAYQYDSSGNRIPQQPEMFYFNATNFQFDSPVDQTYPYGLVYYGQPPALSTLPAPGTNFLTTYYPRLLRCACMAQAMEYMKEAGSAPIDRSYWEQNAIAELEAAQAESDRSRRAMEVGMILV